MQFKNLSVAQKIWALVLFVMVSMLAAGMGMTGYVKNLESHLREQLQDVEERIQVVVELRGSIQFGASLLISQNMAQDPQTIEFFDAQFKKVRERSNQLLEETEKRLISAAGHELFNRIKAQRQKMDDVVAQVALERRNDGDVTAMVLSSLVPAVQSLVNSLNDLVTLQKGMRDQITTDADQARSYAYSIGWGALALVVFLGLLVSVWLVRQLTQPLGHAVQIAETIANGDLSQDVYVDRKDEMGVLLRSLNTMTQKLRAVVAEVRNGVDSVSSAASQIASGNQDLSARTEQTAANLEETAASIEELTATVTQSADTARQANQLAVTAVQAAERGGEVVNQVVMSMDQINTSSRKISDIIGVIDGIAFQTNILALNAAVEAARAGEQGRGFAVVAGEVRSLAQRSAEAAKEIKGLITASVNNVDIGATQVAQAGESMQEIVASVRRVTDLIGEISASSHEQRDGIAQVNQAVSNLDQMTQQNAALVEESSAAATSMNEQAQRLAQVVAVFNVGQAGAVALPVKRAAVMPTSTAAAKPVAPRAAPAPKVTTQSVTTPAAKPVEDAPKLLQPTQASSKTTVNDDDWETF